MLNWVQFILLARNGYPLSGWDQMPINAHTMLTCYDSNLLLFVIAIWSWEKYWYHGIGQ